MSESINITLDMLQAELLRRAASAGLLELPDADPATAAQLRARLDDIGQRFTTKKPYIALGVSRRRGRPTYFFRSAATGQVVRLRLNRIRLDLIALAPLDYWTRAQPGRCGRPDWLRICGDMLREAQRAGSYDPKEASDA